MYIGCCTYSLRCLGFFGVGIAFLLFTTVFLSSETICWLLRQHGHRDQSYVVVPYFFENACRIQHGMNGVVLARARLKPNPKFPYIHDLVLGIFASSTNPTPNTRPTAVILIWTCTSMQGSARKLFFEPGNCRAIDCH